MATHWSETTCRLVRFLSQACATRCTVGSGQRLNIFSQQHALVAKKRVPAIPVHHDAKSSREARQVYSAISFKCEVNVYAVKLTKLILLFDFIAATQVPRRIIAISLVVGARFGLLALNSGLQAWLPHRMVRDQSPSLA